MVRFTSDPMVQRFEEQLISIIRNNTWFVDVLVAVRELKLSSWCVGAGVIRNLVWDHLHHLKQPGHLSESYNKRIAEKGYSARWPLVKVVPC